MNKGTAHLRGPVTREEQAELLLWRNRRRDFAEELSWIEKRLETEADAKVHKVLENDAVDTRKVLKIIDTALARVPDPGSTRLLGKNG